MGSDPSLSVTGPIIMPASGGEPQNIVVLVHGYGSNADDLLQLVLSWQTALPDTVFVAPNGFEPCPGAPGCYQWWGLKTFTLEEGAAGVRRAASILDAFIDEQLARFDLTEQRLALVGFSQGTVLALQTAPRRRKPIAGVVGYSGMVADPVDLTVNLRTRPSVLLVHGDADRVIPIAAFHKTTKTLAGLGFDLTTHISPGLGHSIDTVGLAFGKEFLVERQTAFRTDQRR